MGGGAETDTETETETEKRELAFTASLPRSPLRLGWGWFGLQPGSGT